MSDYTFATVIIADADKAQAQADLGDGFFNFALSATGDVPATHWMSSGPFSNDELDRIVNHVVTWPAQVYLGRDWQGAIAEAGLVPVGAVDDGA